MESISKRTGRRFTGKFGDTALKIGIASPFGEREVKPVASPAVQTPKKKVTKRKK